MKPPRSPRATSWKDRHLRHPFPRKTSPAGGPLSAGLAASSPRTGPRELGEVIGRRLAERRELLGERPHLEAEVLADVREEALRAQRAALMTLLSEGML